MQNPRLGSRRVLKKITQQRAQTTEVGEELGQFYNLQHPPYLLRLFFSFHIGGVGLPKEEGKPPVISDE